MEFSISTLKLVTRNLNEAYRASNCGHIKIELGKMGKMDINDLYPSTIQHAFNHLQSRYSVR